MGSARRGSTWRAEPLWGREAQDLVDFLQRFSVIVREGYAWAGSSFRRGGFGVRMAAEDTENVRRIFVQTLERPKRTIVDSVNPMALELRLKWLSFTPLPRMAHEITTLR